MWPATFQSEDMSWPDDLLTLFLTYIANHPFDIRFSTLSKENANIKSPLEQSATTLDPVVLNCKLQIEKLVAFWIRCSLLKKRKESSGRKVAETKLDAIEKPIPEQRGSKDQEFLSSSTSLRLSFITHGRFRTDIETRSANPHWTSQNPAFHRISFFRTTCFVGLKESFSILKQMLKHSRSRMK